jgi:hypothetical protein
MSDGSADGLSAAPFSHCYIDSPWCVVTERRHSAPKRERKVSLKVSQHLHGPADRARRLERGPGRSKTRVEDFYSEDKKVLFDVFNCRPEICGGNAAFHYYNIYVGGHPSGRTPLPVCGSTLRIMVGQEHPSIRLDSIS